MKKILTFMLVLSLFVSCLFALSGCGKKTLVGFDIDMAREVGARLGIEVSFVEIDWDTKETEIAAGNIDVIWNGFTYSEDRDNGYYDEERQAQIGGLDFSGFYMENRQVAVVKKTAAYTDNASMAGARFAAEKTSAGATAIADIFNAVPIEVDKQLDALTEVVAGTADVAVLDASLASEYVLAENGAYHNTLKVLEIEGVQREYYAIGFREGSDLPAVFNAVLKQLYADGTAQRIAETYNQSGVLYNGFEDAGELVLPAGGDFDRVKAKGKIVIGYTVFAPMAYFPGED